MTGTFEKKSETVVLFDCGKITFQTTQDLKKGQEVYIVGDNTVAKRTAGDQYVIGTVATVPLGDDGDVVINTNLQSVLQGIAKGGALAAGGFVRQNGNISNGLPEFIAAVSGDNATGIVILGGSVDAVVRVGMLEYNKTI